MASTYFETIAGQRKAEQNQRTLARRQQEAAAMRRFRGQPEPVTLTADQRALNYEARQRQNLGLEPVTRLDASGKPWRYDPTTGKGVKMDTTPTPKGSGPAPAAPAKSSAPTAAPAIPGKSSIVDGTGKPQSMADWIAQAKARQAADGIGTGSGIAVGTPSLAPVAPGADAPVSPENANSMGRGYTGIADELNQNRQAGAEGMAVKPLPLLAGQDGSPAPMKFADIQAKFKAANAANVAKGAGMPSTAQVDSLITKNDSLLADQMAKKTAEANRQAAAKGFNVPGLTKLGITTPPAPIGKVNFTPDGYAVPPMPKKSAYFNAIKRINPLKDATAGQTV